MVREAFLTREDERRATCRGAVGRAGETARGPHAVTRPPNTLFTSALARGGHPVSPGDNVPSHQMPCSPTDAGGLLEAVNL